MGREEEMGSRDRKVPSTPLRACNACRIAFRGLSGGYSARLLPAVVGAAWEFTARFLAGGL